MKSIRTNPTSHAPEGDERIRTAVPDGTNDPVYERRGCVEIRWNDDDPDDVVAPWPRSLDGTPVVIHIERMDDDHIWLAIYDQSTGEDVHMDIVAKRGKLLWSVRGSDEPMKKGVPMKEPAFSEIAGAVARGWCHPETADREMDADLAYAITQEIEAVTPDTDLAAMRFVFPAQTARVEAALRDKDAEIARLRLERDTEHNALMRSIEQHLAAERELARLQDDDAVMDRVRAVRHMLQMRVGDKHAHAEAFRRALLADTAKDGQ